MSKIFYDHLLVLDAISDYIKLKAQEPNEREELWRIVDELVHHRVMGCILDSLPREHHEEFLEKFTDAPFDEELIVYINGKSSKKIEDEIKKVIKELESEILKEIKKQKTKV